MASRPSYLGRGRGRGQRDQKPGYDRRSDVQAVQPPSSKANGKVGSKSRQSVADGLSQSQQPKENQNNGHKLSSMANERQRKVDEIRQAAAKFISGDTYNFDSSDSDEDLNDDKILDNTLKTYQGDDDSLLKIKQYLQDSCHSRALTCLICIASVKHVDAIWNCSQCFSIFHLQCIQKWSNDGAVQSLPLSQDVFPDQIVKWFCPKCRCEYKQCDRPTQYVCFCGKMANPKFDPWAVPHSCGETCAQALAPDCGHNCLLLCHPGPCPPCPKTIQATCHCDSQAPIARRCSAKEWSCGESCGKLLACGQHKCKHNCHAGQCPACPEQSSQPCHCGRNVSIRSCDQPDWFCSEVCGKDLDCGNHTCSDVCHRGKCSPCPRSGKRTCPCGKTTLELPCTEDVPVCGDTCDLVLSCGRHSCTMRCHTGSCETCRHVVQKRCRCGKIEKSIQCSKEFTCDIKCPKLRNCDRHACRRKCCDRQCPPCEQICGRQLNCNNHKCPSVCHRGYCYPCPLTQDVSCKCGKTKLSVPCGRERVTKPPKCLEVCKIPSDCHHKERKPHRCHFGKCTPCTEKCGKTLSSCSHTCQLQCHDNKTQIKSKPSTVGKKVDLEEKQPSTSTACPPCTFPLARSCLGEHKVIMIPCSKDSPFSCGRLCGRLVSCTNHTCQLQCHKVSAAPSKEISGAECEQCELPCSKPRPTGCLHECLRKCHPGDCGECTEMVKRKCHCSAMSLYIKCNELLSADETSLMALLSCKGNCPKSIKCGHNCSLQCHFGPCVDVKNCTKKTAVRCRCKRVKKDLPCYKARAASVDCNDDCRRLQIKKQKENNEKERIKLEKELKLQQEEVEKFERKKQRKKRRSPKQQEDTEIEPSFLCAYRNTIIFIVVAVAFVAFIVHIAIAE